MRTQSWCTLLVSCMNTCGSHGHGAHAPVDNCNHLGCSDKSFPGPVSSLIFFLWGFHSHILQTTHALHTIPLMNPAHVHVRMCGVSPLTGKAASPILPSKEYFGRTYAPVLLCGASSRTMSCHADLQPSFTPACVCVCQTHFQRRNHPTQASSSCGLLKACSNAFDIHLGSKCHDTSRVVS